MEHQFRRGIYRPNAQRLSISLTPLVAQRSMMFRVKTDLVAYAEAAEYSPALYSLSESAQIVTAVLTAISVVISTAMSSASVYSQDSWKSSESPFVPVAKVDPDPRRMAMAFSPSIQWYDMASGRRSAVKSSSLCSAFVPQQDVLFSQVKGDDDIKIHSEHTVVPVLASDAALDVGSSSLVKRRHTLVKPKSKKREGQGPERSKSLKAFRKVMAHLSFQPLKRESAPPRRADTVANNLLSMDFKLPEFQVSPIRYSFIAQSHTYPSPQRMLTSDSPSIAPLDTLVEEGVRHQRHTTMPPPVTSSERKGRRHVQSSAAAPSSRR